MLNSLSSEQAEETISSSTMTIKRKREEEEQYDRYMEHYLNRDAKRSRAVEPQLHPRLKMANLPVEVLALPQVVELLNDMVVVPQDELMKAASSGDLNQVKTVLNKWSCAAFEHSAAALAAHANGHLSVAIHLLPHVTSDNTAVAAKIVESAAAIGDLRVLRYFRSWAYSVKKSGLSSWSTPPVCAKDALSKATHGGHIDAVEYLLIWWNWNVLRAIDQALSESQQAIATMIRDKSRLGETLRLAASSSNLKVIEFIYKHCRPEDVYRATSSAARSGDLAIVKFLVQKNPRLLIDNYYLYDDPLYLAVNHGHQAIVKYLVDSQPYLPKSICAALPRAAECGHQEMVDFLFDKECVTSYTIRRSFVGAAKHGQQTTVEFLYAKQSVTSVSVHNAFVAAAKNQQQAMVEFLYAKPGVTSDSVCEAFVGVAKNGHQDIVEFLCDKPGVTSESVQEAFASATSKGQRGIMKCLAKVAH